MIEDLDEEIDEIEWKVNNKVKAVRRTATSELSDLEFEYDAFGRRIMKRVIPKLAGGSIDVLGITTAYYVLDAQGHTLTKYKVENFLNPDGTLGNKLYLVNRNIYGSKLLGQEEIYEVIASTDNNVVDINTNTDMVIGDKRYTLSNHLGNVHQVVTDRKIPEEDNGDIAYFYPDIVSHSDFLPFGMEIEARSSSTSETDFGFNGMYADDEWKGKRNSYDFGARMYDPRVGRWLSRDPKESEQPDQSAYKSFYNSPLMFIDPDGNTEYLVIILKDEESGESEIMFLKSSNDLDASHVHSNSMVNYHDYYKTLTIIKDKDGNIKSEFNDARSWVEPDNPRISLPYGVGGVPYAKFLLAFEQVIGGDQGGGYYMTSANALGTIFKSKSTPKYIGNIDGLVTLLSNLNRVNELSKVLNKSKSMKDAVAEDIFVEFLKKTIPGAVEEMKRFFNSEPDSDEEDGSKTTGDGSTETGVGDTPRGGNEESQDTTITRYKSVQEAGSAYSRTVEEKVTVKKSELKK